MHKFLWIIFIFSLIGSTSFGLSLVYHEEPHLINCTVQLVHSCCYVWLLYGYRKDWSFLYPHSIQMYQHECTNCTVPFIKCGSWWWTNDSLKLVEPINEKLKIIHKNLCITLVYIHTAIWCAVHTMSNYTSFLTNLRSMHSDPTFTCFLLITSFQNNHSSYQHFVCHLSIGVGAMQSV